MPNKAMKITKYVLIAVAVIIVSIIWNAIFYTEVKYSSPVWSPDGKKIYFLKNVDYNKNGIADLDPFFNYYIYKTKSYVMSMNPDGSWKKVLVKYEGVFNKEPRTGSLSDLTISFDGKALYFKRSYTGKGVKGIYKIDIATSKVSAITLEGNEYYIGDYFISPDGDKIAYGRSRNKKEPSNNERSCWLVDSDGGDDHMFYGDSSCPVGWTKNGDLVIILYNKDTKRHEFWEYSLSGKTFINKIKSGFYDSDQEMPKKSLGIVEKTNISPDGSKEIFYHDNFMGVRDLRNKHQRHLLKDIRRP